MDHEVVIVGAGPTGLMLAGELALAGIDVAIVERRADQELESSRAGGLHARTIEVLDQRGIADRFLAVGTTMQVATFASVPLDISDFPTRHNYGLALAQKHIERILAGWLAELPVTRYRREVTGFTEDDHGVTVAGLRAQFVVGCDGGRSVIRKTAAIDFIGCDATQSWLIAELQLAREPPWGMRTNAHGVQAIGKAEDGRARVVLAEAQLRTGEPTLGEVRAALVAVHGTDFGAHSPAWISRFTDLARQAATYRAGRILLAGDAAHVHHPAGGQGLNLGMQDAVNLGWKLAQVVRGRSPASSLDSYQAERQPVAARALRNSLAQATLPRDDARSNAMRAVLSELLRMDEPRKRYAGMMSGLDLHYDLGGAHPLVGRRVPDLDLTTPAGQVRVFELLHRAQPLVIDLGANVRSHVRTLRASYAGTWELPVIGAVAAPRAIAIRPDGYVAWAGDDQAGLDDAVTRWFGTPR